MDQAETLRKLKKNFNIKKGKTQGMKKIAITSGKGGVGKTNTVVNLAIALQKRKKKITVFDADLGLANIDILLGLTPEHNIVDIIKTGLSIEEIIVEGPQGIKIVPASSGIQEITNLDSYQEERLLTEISKIENFTDILLIDTAAGISDLVLSFLLMSEDIIIIVNSEPTSIVDAYAMVKVITSYDSSKQISIVVNSVKNLDEGKAVFDQLNNVADRFLGKDLNLMGFLPFDKRVAEAVRNQKPVTEAFPESEISVAFNNLARILLNKLSWNSKTGDSYESWKKMINFKTDGKKG
jgi:flagellar biosynthesis protein FlhG